jgi:uncharacterized protein
VFRGKDGPGCRIPAVAAAATLLCDGSSRAAARRYEPSRGERATLVASREAVNEIQAPGQDANAACRACGACCSFSREWPRFSLESDAALDLIPEAFVDDGRAKMRCIGDRCAALVGHVGISTSCAVYAVRPDVCRACSPGDDACEMARRRFGL